MCAEPVAVRLSGDDGGVGRVTSAKKIKLKLKLRFFFAFNLTLSDFCMCDDSFGFEDCHLATHLFIYSWAGFLRYRHPHPRSKM